MQRALVRARATVEPRWASANAIFAAQRRKAPRLPTVPAFRLQGLAVGYLRRDARQLRAQPAGHLVRRIPDAVRRGAGAAAAFGGPVPARRVRPLRRRGGADAARRDDALAPVRLPLRRRQGRADGPGGGPVRGLPPGLELRARGADQPPHPAARPERQRQVDVRRLHAARDGALLDARRRRALQVQLDLPVAEADQGRHRLRRRPRARQRPGDVRVPRRRADRVEDHRTRCGTTRSCCCRARSGAT